jgi:hypothetical protein
MGIPFQSRQYEDDLCIKEVNVVLSTASIPGRYDTTGIRQGLIPDFEPSQNAHFGHRICASKCWYFPSKR